MNAELIQQLLVILIPILAPLITAGLKKILPSLPKLAIVIIQPLLGILISVFTPTDPVTGAVLGASGIAVREGVDQAVKALNAVARGIPMPRVGDKKAEVQGQG